VITVTLNMYVSMAYTGVNRRNALFIFELLRQCCATGIRKKINRSHTHTHTDREQHP